MRTYYSWKIRYSADFSYLLTIIDIWTSAEIAIGTVVSCIPVIPMFLRHTSPKIRNYFQSCLRLMKEPLSKRKTINNPTNVSESTQHLNQHKPPATKPSRETIISEPNSELQDLVPHQQYLHFNQESAHVMPERHDFTIVETQSTATKREDLEHGQHYERES